MRYELADDEWAAIKPMLPNKPRGVPRVTTVGYVCVVTAASNDAVRQGFLLVGDAQTLIGFAQGSNVLTAVPTPAPTDPATEARLCANADAQALTATGRTN
jgi:transposase